MQNAAADTAGAAANAIQNRLLVRKDANRLRHALQSGTACCAKSTIRIFNRHMTRLQDRNKLPVMTPSNVARHSRQVTLSSTVSLNSGQPSEICGPEPSALSTESTSMLCRTDD